MHQTDTACAWLVCHSKEGLCKLYPTILPLWRPGPPVFFGSQSCDPAAWLGETLSPSRTKTNTKTLLHTLTKYTNSPVQPSQSSPAHSPTSVQSPLPPLQHTHIPQSIYSTAHTYIPQATYWTSGYLPGGWCLCWWKGRLDTLTSWFVAPLHSYTQEGWVDNNNMMYLSVPIPSSTRCSLGDCLPGFSREEKMKGDSQWFCSRCKCKRDAVKQIVIWKLPRYVVRGN